MTRLVLVALILVGCAANATPTATPAKPDRVADPGPPPMPKEMTRAELDRRIAAGELKLMELEAIDREEVDVPADSSRAKHGPDVLVTSSSMPGGHSSTIYVDRYRRIWVGISHHTVNAPPNVIISATRTFETRWKVPISYRVVGTFQIN